MVSESANNNEKLKELINKFNNIIYNGVLHPVMGEEQIKLSEEITFIRNEVINVMKGLTSLADIFNIYEYVLNRLEYKFKSADHIELEKDEDFATLLSLIFYQTKITL
jgi:hypothetical protein